MITSWMRRVFAVGVLFALLLGGMSTAAAQGAQPSALALEQEFLSLQERLLALQQRVISSDPQLQDMLGEMEDLVIDRMRAAGHDPGDIMETLLAAQGRLQDPNLSAEERMQILNDPELQRAQSDLEAAQAAVRDDPELVAAQSRLEQTLLQAVRALEPNVDPMLRRLQELQAELLRQRP